MKQITITIQKLSVYESVNQESAYVGAKSDEVTDYDKVSAAEEDRSLFNVYWSEACSVLTDVVKPFVVSVSDVSNTNALNLDKDFELNLLMPSNFDVNLVGSIKNSMTNFLSNSIKSSWFAITKKDESERYALDAAANLRDVKSKIYHRNKPLRKPIIK